MRRSVGRPLRFRGGPLRQAAIFAAAFLAVRVVYNATFAGADGTGIRLLALPLVTLPAPFSGVQLLGPITSGGLRAAAWSAVPFAAAILGFGVLNALFDVRPAFAAAARRGPLRSFARALVIAWQTMPALAAALRRAGRAARLRGERSGPRVLVPVLEDSIERAIALAAALELRGFAAERRLEGDCTVPARATDAALERPGWRLSIPALSLAPGTLTVLAGDTGAGKSTVLDALSGLFQHAAGGVQRGLLEVGGLDRAAVPPRETAGFVGAVAQRVRASFAGETVAEELGFTLSLRGVAPVIVAARVNEVAGRLGISHLVERPIGALSAGEAELVALGAAIAENPTLLLVDEPLAELDALARPRVVAALDALAHEAGVCVVVAEHRTSWFEGVADAWLEVAGGELREVGAPGLHSALRAESTSGAGIRRSTQGAAVNGDRTAIAEARGVTVRHGERIVVDDAALDLGAGELVALIGPNGAGKSSLLGELALPAEAGRVLVRGDDVRAMKPRARHAAIALVPEAVEDLFVTDSVAAECHRIDRRLRPGRRTLDRFGALLGRDSAALGDVAVGDIAVRDVAALAETHPRDLSGGQRVCLAIALQLADEPAVLLVDEPVRGLDRGARAEVAAALARAAAGGTAVLFATHEREFADALAHRTIRLDDGRLEGGRLEQREGAIA